jgi:hypothetical protein
VALDPAATPVDLANWRLETGMHFAYALAQKALATAILNSVGASNQAALKVAFHPTPLHFLTPLQMVEEMLLKHSALTGPDLQKLRAPLHEPLLAIAHLEKHTTSFQLASTSSRFSHLNAFAVLDSDSDSDSDCDSDLDTNPAYDAFERTAGDRDSAAELIRGGIRSLSLSARSTIGDHHQQSSVEENVHFTGGAEVQGENLVSPNQFEIPIGGGRASLKSGELHQRWSNVPPTSANVNETNSERLADPVQQLPLISLRGKIDIVAEIKTSSRTAR